METIYIFESGNGMSTGRIRNTARDAVPIKKTHQKHSLSLNLPRGEHSLKDNCFRLAPRHNELTKDFNTELYYLKVSNLWMGFAEAAPKKQPHHNGKDLT